MLLTYLLIIWYCCALSSSQSVLQVPANQCTCVQKSVSTTESTQSQISALQNQTLLLNGYVERLLSMLESLGTNITSLNAATAAKILDALASTSDIASLVNSALSSNVTSSNTVTVAPCKTITNSHLFFGDAIFENSAFGGTFSEITHLWTVPLNQNLITDYSYRSCSSVQQYIEQICIDGNINKAYVYYQEMSSSSLKIVSESLSKLADSTTGLLCFTLQKSIITFSIIPREIKSSVALKSSYSFKLSIMGCFKLVPNSCIAHINTTTAACAENVNAFQHPKYLPVAETRYVYGGSLSLYDGFIISKLNNTYPKNILKVDLTAGGCRADPPLITKICVQGNFREIKVGSLHSILDHTLEHIINDHKFTATTRVVYCFNSSDHLSFLGFDPMDLLPGSESDTIFKIYAQVFGCFTELSAECRNTTVPTVIINDTEISDHTDILPAHSFGNPRASYGTNNLWNIAAGSKLEIDITSSQCRIRAVITKICILATNANVIQISLTTHAEVTSNINVTTTGASQTSPACYTLPSGQQDNIYMSLTPYSTTSVSSYSLKWSLSGTFPVLTETCKAASGVEICTKDLQSINETNKFAPSVAISGVLGYNSLEGWTISVGYSLLIDLTVLKCRSYAQLSKLCTNGNVDRLTIDYILHNGDVQTLTSSTTADSKGTGQLCFDMDSAMKLKAVRLTPRSLIASSLNSTVYKILINASGCYTEVHASCYLTSSMSVSTANSSAATTAPTTSLSTTTPTSPFCSCPSGYRPIFKTSKSFFLQYRIISGSYSIYKTNYIYSYSQDYNQMFTMSETMVSLALGIYTKMFQSLSGAKFTEGSVLVESNLTMYSSNFTAYDIQSALRDGFVIHTASNTYVVHASSVNVTDWKNNTTAEPPVTTTVSPLVIGLAVGLSLLFLICLLILILCCCYYYKVCCFRENRRNTGTMMSQFLRNSFVSKGDQTPRYLYDEHTGESGGKIVKTGGALKMPDYPTSNPEKTSTSDLLSQEEKKRRRKKRKHKNLSTVSPLSLDDINASRLSQVTSEASGRTPKTFSIEVFTYAVTDEPTNQSTTTTTNQSIISNE